MGGEKPGNGWSFGCSGGSPPRGRGKDQLGAGDGRGRWITPAWAGKSRVTDGVSGAPVDHPRVGGEKSDQAILSICREGSPPRGRGKVFRRASIAASVGITPAWAGKRSICINLSMSLQDHPRVGGEKLVVGHCCHVEIRSPPRGRGKALGSMKSESRRGITPAWAGKSHVVHCAAEDGEDHPRVGGEKTPERTICDAFEGSPPRGRGKAFPGPCGTGPVGITPAWAGKSGRNRRPDRRQEDHPRVGGEKTKKIP